jgi:hypothetical protein
VANVNGAPGRDAQTSDASPREVTVRQLVAAYTVSPDPGTQSPFAPRVEYRRPPFRIRGRLRAFVTPSEHLAAFLDGGAEPFELDDDGQRVRLRLSAEQTHGLRDGDEVTLLAHVSDDTTPSTFVRVPITLVVDRVVAAPSARP